MTTAYDGLSPLEQDPDGALDRAAQRAGLLSLVRSGADLYDRDFPALRWAVEGIVPEGMGLFVGPPKVGKSWAVLGVGLAVACGGVALGGVQVDGARPVLYLALEDGERRLQDRMNRLLYGERPDPRFDYVTAGVDGNTVLPLIGAWLDEHDDGPLVVLDTLGKVMPPARSGEGLYERDYRVAGALKRLADTHPGASLVVVHHDRKAGAEDFVDAVSGTHGLAGASDFVVVLQRARNESTGLLKVTGRDVIENEYAVDIDGGHWSLQDGSLADAAAAAHTVRSTSGLGDQSAQIVAYVMAHPEGVNVAAVADGLGIDKRTARTYLDRAVTAERITRPTRGLYTPPVSSVSPVSSDTNELTHLTHMTQGVLGEGEAR